ncbi:MAG: 4'-phosphopantetheinyl transferase superfamily protein [Rhodospirillales bacterium]
MLNREIAEDTPLRFSSAQYARVSDWLSANGVPFDRDALKSGEITVAQIVVPSAGGPGPARTPTPADSRAARADASAGVGIDLQLIDELFPDALDGADFKSSDTFKEIFTLRELSYAQAKPAPRQTLAGIFSAKEAVRKAAPEYLGRELNAIEILHDESGKPVCEGFAISISHGGVYAVAVAVKASVRTPEHMLPAHVEPAAASVPPAGAWRGIAAALLQAAAIVVSLIALYKLKDF